MEDFIGALLALAARLSWSKPAMKRRISAVSKGPSSVRDFTSNTKPLLEEGSGDTQVGN